MDYCLPTSTPAIQTVSEVLPPRQALGLPREDEAQDASNMQQALRGLATATAVPASRVSVLAGSLEYGVSATLHAMVLALLDCVGRNHTLMSPKLTLWADRTACSQTDLSCFFASLPSVDDVHASHAPPGQAAAAKGMAIVGMSTVHWKKFTDALFGPGSAHAIRVESLGSSGSLESYSRSMRERLQHSKHRASAVCRRAGVPCPRVLPLHFVRRTPAEEAAVFDRLPSRWTRRGRFWVVSQALHFLTQPNAALQRQLSRARANLGFHARQPILALHVRKGDACSHRGECRGLAQFMPVVHRVASMYRIRTVFLATPSKEVRAETARYPEFEWLFRNDSNMQHTFKPGAGVVRIEDALLRGHIRPVDEWQSTMIDILLMSESQVLVSALSSSAARLALSLMAARGGCLKPFTSVDINWCFAFLRGGPDVIRRGDAASAMKDSVFRHLEGLTC